MKFSRILQELDNFEHFFLGFFDARDIGERHLLALFSQHPGAALPERQRLIATDLHLTHEEKPEAKEQDEGSPCHQEGDVPGALVRWPSLDLHILFAQMLYQLRIFGRVGPNSTLVLQNCADMVGFDRDFHDLALVQLGHEIAEYEVLTKIGYPLLVGVSRKQFIGNLVQQPVHERGYGTAGAVAVAVLKGAQIIRVHDVRTMRDTVSVVSAISRHARSHVEVSNA